MLSRPAILERVIRPGAGDLPSELARYILGLQIDGADVDRYLLLSEKAQAGTLAPEERAELEDYLTVNAFLTILKSKARVSLRTAPAA